MADKFYVTTPIYYVNARPHIGHAYTTIVADVLARRARAQGTETWFLTGTDEHGQKIERSAAAAGIEPQQFADQVSASFESLWKRMGITNDQYIRTTSPGHKRGVQQLFRTLYDNGKIYLSSYTGQYSVGEEMFVEGPPGTIGPDGRPTETVTEENFFFRLSEYQLPLLDLIESDTLKITPESRKNEVLSFLRGNVAELGATPLHSAAGHPYLPGALKDLSISRSSFTWGITVPDDIQQRAGAKDKHIVYVWLDALANYITALGYGSDDDSQFHKFWPAELHLVGKEIIRFHCVYWPAFLLAAGLELPKAVTAHGWLLFEDSKMSKSKGNIVRTETILDAFGTLSPAPGDRDLFATDVLRYFLLREIPFGQDGSFTFDALITRYNADLANGYGNLVSRTLKMIEQSLKGVVERPDDSLEYADNAEEKSRFVVESAFGRSNPERLGEENPELTKTTESDVIRTVHRVVGVAADKNFALSFNVQLGEIGLIVAMTDRFISDHAPWKLAKSSVVEDRAKLIEVLYTAAESIRIITALLHPILPYATACVWRQLGLGDITTANLTNLTWGGLESGTRLGPLAPIFPRADKKLAEVMTQMEQDKNAPLGANAAHDTSSSENTDFQQAPIGSEAVPGKKPLSKLVDETSGHTAITNPAGFDPAAGPRTSSLAEPNAGAQVAGSSAITTERPGTPPHLEAEPSGIFAAMPKPVPLDESISIDDFAKVELRVAQIVVCERIPKADKLLRLEVDLGTEKRQILSGIAEWYTPEDLVGRRIVVITNLAPRKMRGLESHGMLLAASSEGGKPALATFLDSDVLPLGSRLK